MSRTSNTVSIPKHVIELAADLNTAVLGLAENAIDILRNPETSRTTLSTFKGQVRAIAHAFKEHGEAQTGYKIEQLFASIGEAAKGNIIKKDLA